MQSGASVFIKVGHVQRGIQKEIIVGIDEMFRKARYAPHCAFNRSRIKGRASRGQTFENIVMRDNLDEGRIAFSLGRESIEQPRLLIVGDDEDTPYERRELNHRGDIVIDFAIVEVALTGYRFEMCLFGIWRKFLPRGLMRRVLTIHPRNYVIDFQCGSLEVLQFYN